MEQGGANYSSFANDAFFELSSYINKISFQTSDINRIPAKTLAYIGDAVYELLLRLWLMNTAKESNYKIAKSLIPIVNCHFQSCLFDKIFPNVCLNEQMLLKNWRNSKCNSKCYKVHMKISYSKATALEAFIGYLFLTKQINRIYNIIDLAINEYNRSLNLEEKQK